MIGQVSLDYLEDQAVSAWPVMSWRSFTHWSVTRRALAGFEPTFPIITACLASALKRLLWCTRQCAPSSVHVQSVME